MAKFCQQCGSLINDDSRFCGACGALQKTVYDMQAEQEETIYSVFKPEYPTAADPNATVAANAEYAPIQERIPAQPVQAVTPAPMPDYSNPAFAYPPAPAPDDYQPYGTGYENQPTYAADQPYYGGDPAPKKPKKEKKPMTKKKMFTTIGISAGAVAVLAAVFFIFILPMFRSSSPTGVVTRVNGKDYYSSPYMFKLNGDGTPSFVYHKGDDSDGKYAYFSFMRAAAKGNTIYTSPGLPLSLEKIEFTSDTTVKQSTWVDMNTVTSAVFADKGSERPEAWMTAMRNWYVDGNYVYFNLIPTAEYAVLQRYLSYQVGRISLDGKTIERVGNIYASSMAVSGGWIYYFDNGYYYDADHPQGAVDFSRVGIYKVKTDGSSKQKIRGITLSSKQAEYFENGYRPPNLCDEMQIFNGKLYYTDYSVEGKGRVCCMNLNGGGIQYVSAQPAYHYTVDTDKNAVYYTIMTEYDETSLPSQIIDPVLRKYMIGSGSDTVVSDHIRFDVYLGYSGGYVYFASDGYHMGMDTPELVGTRVNTATGQMQRLMGCTGQSVEYVTDERGRMIPKQIDGEPQLYWENYNP